MTNQQNRSERRHNRSANISEALRKQLRAEFNRTQLTAEQLSGLLLADENGMCMARAGDGQVCDEIAAHLPLMGNKVDKFSGVLYGPAARWNIQMQRITVEGFELYLCAVGTKPCNDQLAQSLHGVSRILRCV